LGFSKEKDINRHHSQTQGMIHSLPRAQWIPCDPEVITSKNHPLIEEEENYSIAVSELTRQSCRIYQL